MVVLLWALGVVLISIPQQRNLSQTRDAMNLIAAERKTLDERAAAATTELERARQELSDQREKQMSALVGIKQAEQHQTEAVSNERWALPPTSAPMWDQQSPYVWMNKEVLEHLSTRPFTFSGELRVEIANVLAMTEGQRHALNRIIPRLFAEFRALEVAAAARSQSPPKTDGDSPKITVRIKPLPVEGAHFRQQLEASLQTELGEQRKNLLLSFANVWLRGEFNDFGSKERVISARHSNGVFDISAGSSSMSGMRTLDGHVPAHLLPFFENLNEFALHEAK